MLATNFGSLCPEVTNFGSQHFGYQIWFCTRLDIVTYFTSSCTLWSWSDTCTFLPFSPPDWRGYCCNSLSVLAGGWLPDFVECISLKSLDGFSLFEVLWNCPDLKLHIVMVICPFAPYGFAHGSETCLGVGGAVRFLVVGTIGQEERPPRGQLWMEQCLTSLKYWPIWYTIWADPNYTWGLAILADSFLFSVNNIWRAYG